MAPPERWVEVEIALHVNKPCLSRPSSEGVIVGKQLPPFLGHRMTVFGSAVRLPHSALRLWLHAFSAHPPP